jgi:hypothetical protein
MEVASAARARSLKPTWPAVLVWFLLVLLVSTLGTYFSYHGPLSSDAWRLWAGKQRVNPVTMDVLRVVLSGLAAVYVLWGMGVFSSRRPEREGNLLSLPLRQYEWWVLAVSAILLLVSALVFQPLYAFRPDLIRLGIHVPLTFEQITKPYFVYCVYMIGLWLGIALPVFLIFVRSVLHDWKEWKQRWQVTFALNRNDLEVTPQTFREFVVDMENYFLFLKEAAERYFPLLLAVITILVLEQFTELASSATPAAADVAKTLLWVFWMPALGVSLYLFGKVYEDALAAAKTDLSVFVDKLRAAPDKHDLLDKIMAKRGELDRDRGPMRFMFSVVTGGRVSVYALGAFVGFWVRGLSKYEDLAKAFFPTWMIDFVSRLIHNR